MGAAERASSSLNLCHHSRSFVFCSLHYMARNHGRHNIEQFNLNSASLGMRDVTKSVIPSYSFSASSTSPISHRAVPCSISMEKRTEKLLRDLGC